MIKLTEILSEISDSEIDEVVNENSDFDRGKYYEQYYKNLSPNDFEVERDGNVIKITLPTTDEALTPMQKLARKRAMAGKKRMIQRKRQRTMLRKKGSKQLYKKAYKAAYRDVYEFFRNRLFPDVPKSELTIIQKKQIEKWVAKKKKKVLKRARFKYLPMFREKEAEKFGGKSNIKF